MYVYMTFLSSLAWSSSVVVACGYREPKKHSECWKLWLPVVPAGCENPQPLMESMHLEHANLFQEVNAFKTVYRMELIGDCGFVAEQALRATILIRVPKSRQHVCFNALVVDLNFEITAEVCEEGYLGAAGDPLRGVGAFLIIGSLSLGHHVRVHGDQVVGHGGQRVRCSEKGRGQQVGQQVLFDLRGKQRALG